MDELLNKPLRKEEDTMTSTEMYKNHRISRSWKNGSRVYLVSHTLIHDIRFYAKSKLYAKELIDSYADKFNYVVTKGHDEILQKVDYSFAA